MTPLSVSAGTTISVARRNVADALRSAGVESAEIDARLLIGHALSLDHAAVTAAAARMLEASEAQTIERLAQRRLAREPIAYITGRREFWGLTLRVTPDVLIPRPDSETLIEAALDLIGAARAERLSILDIGTGSGALLLAMLSECPDATGVGVDVSDAALSVAQENAHAAGMADRARFVHADIIPPEGRRFDLILSNPPYIASRDIVELAPDVREYEPHLALDGGADGLTIYRRIAASAAAVMAGNALLMLELGAGQEADVSRILTDAGLRIAGPARRDLAGIPRALAAWAR